jgi:hypothetical protein
MRPERAGRIHRSRCLRSLPAVAFPGRPSVERSSEDGKLLLSLFRSIRMRHSRMQRERFEPDAFCLQFGLDTLAILIDEHGVNHIENEAPARHFR